jgi:hypothetical protein
MEPRDPCNVINAILKHVPQELTELRATLEKIQSNAQYVPPEGMNIIWRKLGYTLEHNLNMPPIEDWEKTIHNIVRNKQ